MGGLHGLEQALGALLCENMFVVFIPSRVQEDASTSRGMHKELGPLTVSFLKLRGSLFSTPLGLKRSASENDCPRGSEGLRAAS